MKRNGKKTKEQLTHEVADLLQRISELEALETERKKMKETLRESEQSLTLTKERLHYILETNPAVVYSCKPEGNYAPTFISGNVKNQLGYEPAEFLDDPEFWVSHIHPEDTPRVFAELPSIFEKNYHSHIYRFKHKNGTYIWMYDELKLIRDEKGNPMEIIGYWTDITERKRAEEVLRESESWLRTILTSAPITIFAMDKQGVFTLSEGRGLEQVGLKPGENVGVSALELYGEMPFVETTGAVISGQDIVRRALLGETVSALNELRGVYFDNHIGPLRDPDGKVIGIVGVATDITKRKELEQAQQEMHKRFRVLFDQAAESIIVVDPETGALVEFNEQAHENLGYTRDEFSKLRIADFEAMESPEEITKHLKKIIVEGSDTFETKHRTKDGKIRDIQVSSRSISITGENFVQTIWLDITARKKMEEELREERDKAQKYFNIAGVILVVIDCEQKVTLINRKGCEVLGYEEGEIVGKNWIDNFIPPRLKLGLIAVSQTLLTGDTKTVEHYENPILTRSGEEKIIAWHNTVLRDGKGNIIGHLSSGEDITERVRMEEELRQSGEQLRELAAHLEDAREKERTAISHEIHDELGQLLTGLKLDIMSAKRRLTEDQPYLQGKMTSALSLIDETMSGIRRISRELRPVLLDDLGLAPAIKLATKEFCERAGIKCTVRLEPIEAALAANLALAIFRVFQEAITNIVRHAEAKKALVSLKQRHDNIILEVRDNGKGIDQDTLNDAKSFGLQGMRERALYWGGEVDVQSTPGKGTTVILTVPIRNEGAGND